MKKTVLTTTLSLLAVALLAGCTSGGGKKKKSSGATVTSATSGQSGDVSEMAWQRGFAGCVSVGAQAALESATSHVMPSKPEASIVNLTKTKSWQDTQEFVTYDYTYDYVLDQDPWKAGETETKEQHYVQSIDDSGSTYRVVNFKNWPSQAAEEADWPRFKIKVTCHCNGQDRQKEYTLILDPLDKVYIVMSFDDIYSMNGDHLKWTKMGQDGGFIGDLDQTESQNRYWIETWGRVIYATADGNWGLVANGDKVLQLYRLDEMGNKWNYTKFKDKNVIIKAALDFGYGNPQASYVQDIAEIETGDTTHPVAEPVINNAFTEAMLSNKQWNTNPLFNKIGSIAGAKYNGNLRSVKNASAGGGTTIVQIAEDKKSSITPKTTRYEFDIKVGSLVMTVATDYHACKDSDAFTNAVKDWIVNASVGSAIKVEGTVRWANPRKSSPTASTCDVTNSHMIMPYNSAWSGYTDYLAIGGWTVTPYLASQVQ